MKKILRRTCADCGKPWQRCACFLEKLDRTLAALDDVAKFDRDFLAQLRIKAD